MSSITHVWIVYFEVEIKMTKDMKERLNILLIVLLVIAFMITLNEIVHPDKCKKNIDVHFHDGGSSE